MIYPQLSTDGHLYLTFWQVSTWTFYSLGKETFLITVEGSIRPICTNRSSQKVIDSTTKNNRFSPRLRETLTRFTVSDTKPFLWKRTLLLSDVVDYPQSWYSSTVHQGVHQLADRYWNTQAPASGKTIGVWHCVSQLAGRWFSDHPSWFLSVLHPWE